MTIVNLAYIPSPPQGVWHLGPIPIRAYALCIIAGIIAALVIAAANAASSTTSLCGQCLSGWSAAGSIT